MHIPIKQHSYAAAVPLPFEYPMHILLLQVGAYSQQDENQVKVPNFSNRTFGFYTPKLYFQQQIRPKEILVCHNRPSSNGVSITQSAPWTRSPEVIMH